MTAETMWTPAQHRGGVGEQPASGETRLMSALAGCRPPTCRLLLLASLAVSVALSPAWAQVANPHGVAVVIGNRDYEHKDVPDVTFAHRDADAFLRYVVEVLGYDRENVIDLRDATRRQLFDALGTRSDPKGLLWSYLDPDGGSDVVVYYSGHGVPGVNDGRGYLLPVDADPKAAEDDGYPIDLLYRNVGGLAEARSVRVYLDACFSGGSHVSGLIGEASPVYMSASLPTGVGTKVTSLAAASGKQVASWDEKAGHGMFTDHLLDALYGAGDADRDGQVTAAEAKRYLDRHMTRAARRQHRRVQQASLVGIEDAVLATAPASGVFPSRPGLGEPVPVVTGSDSEDDPPPVFSPEEVEKGLGLSREDRLMIQMALASTGHDPGPAVGVLGGRTRKALRAWQESMELEGTGYLTREQSEGLVAMGHEEAARRVQAKAERERREREERKRADDAEFVRAESKGTVEAFDRYLASCDVCGHEAKARRLKAVAALSPKCPVKSGSCWIELANKPGCYALISRRGKFAVEWSGRCEDGLATGEGTLSYSFGNEEGPSARATGRSDGLLQAFAVRYTEEKGPYVEGKKHGHWVEGDGLEEGPYVEGKKHGHWVTRFRQRDIQSMEGPYVKGEMHGLWKVRRYESDYGHTCQGLNYNHGNHRGYSDC